MTKEEFKKRWESDEDGGGITFDDIANCAQQWGISLSPRSQPIFTVLYKVLRAADTIDAEEFNPRELR